MKEAGGQLNNHREAARALLAWYGENKRDLPWRRDPSPYQVWISEIMLQQTRVEAVIGYYERFLEALPDVRALAEAPEDLYLKLWEGLGYYSRVRNLHKAARVVTEELGGEMPRTAAELLKLPGIGPYTAAAIASIACGEDVPAVDGNLLRVFARLTDCHDSILTPKARKDAEGFFSGMMPEGTGGTFNQALMDLGATVCLPNGAPRCEVCPVADRCLAKERGTAAELPYRPKKAARKVDDLTVFLIRMSRGVLLHKRPGKGLLAGLYEFPNATGHLTEKEAAAYVEGLGLEPLRLKALEPAKHIFTHREWHMEGYEVRVSGWQEFEQDAPDEDGYFVADKEDIDRKWSVPSAFAAFRDKL